MKCMFHIYMCGQAQIVYDLKGILNFETKVQNCKIFHYGQLCKISEAKWKYDALTIYLRLSRVLSWVSVSKGSKPGQTLCRNQFVLQHFLQAEVVFRAEIWNSEPWAWRHIRGRSFVIFSTKRYISDFFYLYPVPKRSSSISVMELCCFVHLCLYYKIKTVTLGKPLWNSEKPTATDLYTFYRTAGRQCVHKGLAQVEIFGVFKGAIFIYWYKNKRTEQYKVQVAMPK